MNVQRLRRVLILLLVVIAVGFTAINVWMVGGLSTVPEDQKPRQSFAPASIGGTFSLTNQHGEVVTDSQFRGRLMLVFFGFSECPDICPVAMLTITNVLNRMGSKAADIAPIFITLDPERDTPARLAEWVGAFHPSVTALTGSQQALTELVAAYKAYAAKQSPDAEGNYRVDHSGFIYLMGRDGRYLAHFAHSVPEATLEQALQDALP